MNNVLCMDLITTYSPNKILTKFYQRFNSSIHADKKSPFKPVSAQLYKKTKWYPVLIQLVYYF
jgi:hypothetical protein